MIGDFLYSLTGRDAQLARHEIFRRNFLQDGAFTSLAETIVVSQEFVLHLTGATFFATAGAGQLVERFAANFKQLDGSGNAVGPDFIFIDHDVDEHVTMQLDIWVPPGHIIGLSTQFDADLNSNHHEWSLFGVLLPRGNILS